MQQLGFPESSPDSPGCRTCLFPLRASEGKSQGSEKLWELCLLTVPTFSLTNHTVNLFSPFSKWLSSWCHMGTPLPLHHSNGIQWGS